MASFLGSEQTGVQNVSSTIDPDLKQAYLNQINFANTVASRPFQQYEGPQVAGFSGDQQQAFGGIRGMQGAADPYFQQAGNTFQNLMGFNTPQVQAGSFLSGNIGAYQNPYTSQVIDQSMNDLNRARLMQQQGINAQALSRGAFGGSRQAIGEAENNRNFMDQQARTSAQLRNQGFDTAASLMQADLNRNMNAQQLNQQGAISGAGIRSNAANNFMGVGTGMQAQRLGELNALAGIGGLQQQQTQQNLNVAKQQFDTQFNYPLQQLQIRQSALPTDPKSFGGNTATPIFENRAAQLAGLAGVGSQIAGNLGITGSDIVGAGSALFNRLPSFDFLGGLGKLFGGSSSPAPLQGNFDFNNFV